MTRILFVCHGNICRSPMAEFIMKKLVSQNGLSQNFHIESAATSTEEIGNDIHSGTKNILLKNDVPFSKRKATVKKGAAPQGKTTPLLFPASWIPRPPQKAKRSR